MGMAPGVGKTYKMLEEAHRRHERGTDVVVGFVETYGRRHTAALLDGLEIVPRHRVEYRGVAIEEMDADAIVARHPAVVLVDELAHTNVRAPRARSAGRTWRRSANAGIEVVSTCNVQHVESVAEAVETILGVPVHERVPDEVVRAADEIELVDMSPHALRQRMRHGNVYPPDRAIIALERFFTEPNLMALRDLSLRFVAGRADQELEGAVFSQGITLPRSPSGSWPWSTSRPGAGEPCAVPRHWPACSMPPGSRWPSRHPPSSSRATAARTCRPTWTTR